MRAMRNAGDSRLVQMNYHFSLRPARATDAQVLAVLASQVWLHTYATEGVSPVIADYVLEELQPAKFVTLLADPSVTVVVAEHADNLVGFATLRRNVQCPADALTVAELKTLYVQAHFMGRGVGSSLLRHAQALAWAQSGSALWLSVNAKNQRAINFYTAHSYQQVGLQMFMLGGVGHENYVMVGPPLTPP